MPNPFNSLEDLLLSALQSHLDAAAVPAIASDVKLVLEAGDEILANQELIKGALSMIIDNQKTLQLTANTTAADVLAIKTFLGLAGAVASQADLDKLGAKLAAETLAVQQFDQTIPIPAGPQGQGPMTIAPQTTTTKEQQAT